MGHGTLKQALFQELCLPILSSEPVSTMKERKILLPLLYPRFPCQTTVNTFKIFWSKRWFITSSNYLCSRLYLHLQISKNIFSVQSVSHLMSVVLQKPREKVSFYYRKYNYTIRWKMSFLLSNSQVIKKRCTLQFFTVHLYKNTRKKIYIFYNCHLKTQEHRKMSVRDRRLVKFTQDGQ